MKKGKWVVVGLVVLVSLSYGEFSRTTGLIDVPTAPSLKHGEFGLVFNSSYNIKGGMEHPTELDLAVKFGLGDRFEGAISAFNFDAFALSGSYLLMEESEKRPSIAFGIDNITYDQYMSPIGRGDSNTYTDHLYRYRNPEIVSAFLSFTKNFYFVRMTVGFGRGRFVGYGPRSHYFNTDGLFGDTYETGEGSAGAVGMFFGGALLPHPNFEIIGEMDGRDFNAGARYKFKYGAINLALSHIEGIWTSEGGSSDHFSSRIAAGFELSSRILTEKPKHGIIAGNILDQTNQQRVHDAILNIEEVGKKYRIKAGRFKLTLKPGAYTFRVTKKDYKDKIKRVQVRPAKTVEVAFYMLKTPKAIEKAKKADTVEVIMRRAVYFYNQDSLLQAKSQFSEVLKLDPDNNNAKTYLASVNKKISHRMGIYKQNALVATDRKDYETAIANWEKVLQYDPENHRAKTEIAVLKRMLSKPKPKPRPKPKPKVSKEEVNALYQKGVRLFAQKRYKEALRVFNSVLRISPNHTGAKKYRRRTRARIKAMGG